MNLFPLKATHKLVKAYFEDLAHVGLQKNLAFQHPAKVRSMLVYAGEET